jgi:endo-1,4-beta-xylanase
LKSSALDRLATTGLPIYISELDINFSDDDAQLNRFKTLFPMLWHHPAVKGITFWGYKFTSHSNLSLALGRE